MKRLVLVFLTGLWFGVAQPTYTFADTLFESGTLGPTGIYINEIGGGVEPGGAVVSPFVFNGVRFEITQPVITSRVGGHFVADPRFGSSFFGAIVRLDDATDFPDSGNLSTPDLLGATRLTFPNPSAEVFGDLVVSLDPGWYALVFGSGLFGATGSGGMLLNNPDIATPAYIGFQPGAVLGWGNLSPIFHNFRFAVEGSIIPEPAMVAMILGAAPLVMSTRLLKRC